MPKSAIADMQCFKTSDELPIVYRLARTGAPKLGRIMDAIVTLGVDIVNELQKQVEQAAEQAHGAYGGSVLPAAGK